MKLCAPVSYWSKLHKILYENVPSLYRDEDKDHYQPVMLTNDEFYTASMILNNVRLVPRDHEMDIPKPNPQKSYDDFEQTWEDHIPNFVIGYPEIKTCANHRMEILVQGYDFVAWKAHDNVPITFLTHNIPLEQPLVDFFKALALFQRTLGTNSLGIFDYYVEGKIIRLSRRYVASKEEYLDYWKRTSELNQKILENRQQHYRCFWCYQTFLGLTAQGMSKGILYDRSDHIPRAMQDLIMTVAFINIPLFYISKTICEVLGHPEPKDALVRYNQIIDDIVKELEITPDDKEFATKFEMALYQTDINFIKTAAMNFQLDFSLVNNISNADRYLSSSGDLQQSHPSLSDAQNEDDFQILLLLGSEGKIVQKMDSSNINFFLLNQSDHF